MTTDEPAPTSLVGQTFVVDIGAVAHGGHMVARHESRVVFVRHAIPGERARVVVTEGDVSSRFLRADVVDILVAAPTRVEPPCPHAGPGRCGGCDFQHLALPAQRALLGDVIREQLHRLADLDWDGEVEPVAGDDAGLGWRTRVRFTVTPHGGPGLRRHRSHAVEPIERCLIGHPALPDVRDELAAGATSATAVVTSSGQTAVVTDRAAAPVLTERAVGRTFDLQAGDFWQVHPGAADALGEAVLGGLEPVAGDHAWDLYAGVGLFSAVLGRAVGPGGRVVAVESHRRAVRHGLANLADLPQARFATEPVDRFVRSRQAQGRLDLVVLDPPRAGAGAAIARAIATRGPRSVAYVACDPAGLARDLATFGQAGYRLDTLRAFDIFPMTHHVECVAILRRTTPTAVQPDERRWGRSPGMS